MTTRPFELAVRYRSLLLLALGLLLYLPALGSRDLWYPDEPDIGEVTQAMYVSGDWIVPRRMGEIWVDYPPMTYWAGTVTSHLMGGMTELSLRLPIALAAIAMVLITASFASRWYDERTGLWAGLAMLTFGQFTYEAISFRPDMLFSLFISSSLLLYATAFGEKRVRWGPRIAAFAILGLAILSKGPLGVLLPGLVLTVWHGSRREWRRIFELAPLALVALAVALPWYVACALSMGVDNLGAEMWSQSFGRFSGSAFGERDRGHIQPFHYYMVSTWADLFPWSFLLPSSIWWLVRSGRWRDPRTQLAFCWLGSFLVFLSLAITKRQIYLLPAYPAVALMLAPWLSRVGRKEVEEPAPDARHARWLALGFALTMAVIGVLALIGALAPEQVIARFEMSDLQAEVVRGLRWPLLAMTAATVPPALWIGLMSYRSRVRRALGGVALTVVAFWMVGGWALMPSLDPLKGYSEAGAWLADRVATDQPLGLVNGPWDHGWRKRGGLGYYSHRHLILLEDRADLASFIREHPSSLVLVYDDLAEETFVPDESSWRSRIVGEIQAGRYRYFAVEPDPRLLGNQESG